VFLLGKTGKINGIVGFRIPPTLKNAEVWMQTNTRTGLLMILHGLSLIMFGLILPLSVQFLLIMLLLPLTVYVAYGTWYAYHLESQL